MKVLHLSAGSLRRGASRGALWLHQGLLGQGVHSRFLTTDAAASEPGVQPVAPGRAGSLLLAGLKQLDRLPLRAYRFDRRGTLSPGWIGLPIQAMPGYHQADLIHLHWINDGLLDLRSLRRCPKPIVWTVRDLWPTTGLCHYPQGCERQAAGCGHCPLLPAPAWPWPDPSRRGFRRKQRALRQAPITFVGISPWVSQQLRTSPITAGRPVEMIWNCIDEQRFQPLAKEEARRALGLDPAGGPYVLAELRSPASEPWKGFQHLLQILPQLQRAGIRLLLFGAVPPDLEGLLPSDVRLFGRIDNDAQLRRLYAAADVFVCPTLEEAFGKTMAEAMACGTPVLAFRCSAPADLVEPGLTGALVEAGNAAALWQGLQQLLPQARRMAAPCAECAVERFSAPQAAQAYQQLYGRLLHQAPALVEDDYQA
jgi:glycosyltransferase involved in cell wall biosynthesis